MSLRARWSQPLRHLAFLGGSGVLLGLLIAAAVAFLPVPRQRALVGALSWLPGLHQELVLEGEGDALAPHFVLVAEWTGGRALVRHPADDAAWRAVDARVEVSPLLPLALASAGAIAGVLFVLVWHAPAELRTAPIAGLLLAALLGHAVALSLAPVGSGWGAFWMRGWAALPGVEERDETPDTFAGAVISQARTLRSGSRELARRPAGSPPWPDTATPFEVTARGRWSLTAWLALAGLGVGLAVASRRADAVIGRAVLAGLGLTLVAWMALAFAPSALQEAFVRGLASAPALTVAAADEGAGRVGVELWGCELASAPGVGEPDRAGRVRLALVPVLAGPLALVAALAGALASLVRRGRQARERRRLEAERRAAEPPDSLPLLDDGGSESPAPLPVVNDDADGERDP